MDQDYHELSYGILMMLYKMQKLFKKSGIREENKWSPFIVSFYSIIWLNGPQKRIKNMQAADDPSKIQTRYFPNANHTLLPILITIIVIDQNDNSVWP
jgi:hypothetical protein